jgi:formylglycine-generating enzyme required for sulfatase activity
MRFGPTLLLALVAASARPAVANVTGRVVRVEAPRRIEVRIDSGKFLMGVDEETQGAAVAQCQALFDDTSRFGSARNTELCVEYLEALSRMEPRDVHLDAYFIDRDEVSVADYRTCVAAGACNLDPLVSGDDRYIRSEWPIVNITWYEAQDYCKWRGGRLPTEAEWERAARGDDPSSTWPWGELEQPTDFNHGQPRNHAMRTIDRQVAALPVHFFGDPDDADGNALLAPPGSYVWGESPFGTRDQAGNVAEWTADAWIHSERVKGYADLPPTNPYREGSSTKTARVVRGGSWRQPVFVAKSNLRDPFNLIYEGDRRFSHVGFRCARSVRPTTPVDVSMTASRPRP